MKNYRIHEIGSSRLAAAGARVTAALLALSVGAGLAATPALAADTAAAQTVEVNYSDLNLRSTAGAATLEARVRRAAERLCGAGPFQGRPDQAAAATCVAATVNAALPQVRATIAAEQRLLLTSR